MRLDSKATRVVVAIGGLVTLIVGAVMREREIVALGAAMLGWVSPWTREIALDREIRRALAEMEQGHPREAQRRLRRASREPPFSPPPLPPPGGEG